MSKESKNFYPTPPTARAVLPDAPFIPRTFTAVEAAEVEQISSDAESRRKRQTGFETSTSKPTYCDGVDEIGCFQVKELTISMEKIVLTVLFSGAVVLRLASRSWKL